MIIFMRGVSLMNWYMKTNKMKEEEILVLISLSVKRGLKI